MADKASTLPTRGRPGRSGARGRRASWAAGAVRLIKMVIGARGHWLVPLIVGLLLGRVTVFGVVKPFGTAYVIALAALGLRSRALVATAGAIIGDAAGPSLTAGVTTWPVLLVAWSVTVAAGRWFHVPPPITALGALSGAASLRLVAAAFVGDELLLAGFASAAEMLAVAALFPAARLSAARPAGWNRGQAASALILLGLLVMGTEGVVVYGYPLTGLLMRALVLIASAVGGMGLSTATATTMSLMAALGTGGWDWSAVVLSPAGLLAGLGARFGRVGAAAGLLVGHMILSPYAADGFEIALSLVHALLAAALTAMVSRRHLDKLAALVPGTPQAREARRERIRLAESSARQQLRKLASALEDVGRWLAKPRSSGVEAGESFDRFVLDVAERVCAGCSNRAVCWESHVYGTYRDLLTTAAAVSDGGTARPEDLPEGLRGRCIKPQHLVAGINRLLTSLRPVWHAASSEDTVRISSESPGGLDALGSLNGAAVHADVYSVIPRQFAGMAGIIGAVADRLERLDPDARGADHAGREAPLFVARRHKPRYRLAVDVAQSAAAGSHVSGDAFRRVDLPDHRVVLTLSDGMGTGQRAAVESEAAVTMLERFLVEGFDLAFAVQTINLVLLLRSPGETFATLDVCLFDLYTGSVQILKKGAPPTYIRRAAHVEVVRAESLPVGIFQSVETSTMEYRLHAGDLVVMVTDGALEFGSVTGDKAEALGRALRRMEPSGPHETVEGLFKRAHAAPDQPVRDDVTIVAAQLLPV